MALETNDCSERIEIRQGETPGPLTWSMFAGFIAWGFDLGVSYPLQQHACAIGNRIPLHVTSIVCLLVAFSGCVAGWKVLRGLPDEKSEEGGRPVDRAHFQALLGIGFSLAFALVIIANAVPRWTAVLCN